MRTLFYLILLVVSMSPLYSRDNDAAIDEVRLGLSDLKHAMHTYQVDLKILEEKLSKQEASLKALNAPKSLVKATGVEEKLLVLEKKIADIERIQERTVADLRSLSTHANTTSSSLVQYRDKIHELELTAADVKQKLAEVVKLKGTLSSLSKAMQKPDAVATEHAFGTYKVKSGDNLEKIAKHENTTVEYLKKINHLENDKICIGQILKTPSKDE